MIQDPIGFKKAMLDAKHEYELEMSRGPVPVSPPLREAPETPPERARRTRLGRDFLGQRPAAGPAAPPAAPPPAEPRCRPTR